MDFTICSISLCMVLLQLRGCEGVIHPLTSRAEVTFTANLTEEAIGHWQYFTINSLALLPDNRHLLVGARTGHWEEFSMRLLSLDQERRQQTRDTEILGALPGDVLSLAVLSNGQVAMTQKPYKDNKVYILEVRENNQSRVVRSFPSQGRYYYDNLCCAVVAPGPRDNTLLVATYNDKMGGDRSSHIEVRSITGENLETLVYNVKFRVNQMAVFGEKLYAIGMSQSQRFWLTFMTFNMRTGGYVERIGGLHMKTLSKMSFSQGGFDQHGNFYVATHNSSGCTDPHRTENTCCSCILVITPEGDTRVIQPSEVGYPDNDYRHVTAVVATPTGFVAASVAVWRHGIYSNNDKRVMGVIQFYDFVE